jgi:hypothetical protein
LLPEADCFAACEWRDALRFLPADAPVIRICALFPEVHVLRAQAILKTFVVRMVERGKCHDVEAVRRKEPRKNDL